jgi:hypothetical protein
MAKRGMADYYCKLNMCIFLILARRRLYGRMGMGFAGREMRMIDIEWWHNIGMDCAWGGGNRKGRTRNGQNREWQNAEWPTTIASLISSRDL